MRPPNPPNRLLDVPIGHPFYWDTNDNFKELQDNHLRKELGDYMCDSIKKWINKLKNFKNEEDMINKLERFIKQLSLKFHPDK